MARSFIYDSVGFSEATLTAGSFAQAGDPWTATFTANSALISNLDRLADQNISLSMGNYWEQYEVLRIDLGSQKSPNAIALYHPSAEQNDLVIYASNSSTTWVTGDYVNTLTTDHPANDWNTLSLSITDKQYIYIYNGTADYYAGVSEMILGTKYDFAVNPELNAKTGEEFGTDIMTSYGGNEYANKRHAPKTTWDWNWSHILSTQKTALEDLNASVQDWKKFIYYDDTNYHYVRMTKPVTFTEVAPSVYSANMSLREQLS